MTAQTAGKMPQIRFKGFLGEWEGESIGEVLAEKKRPIVLKDRQRYELITVKRRNEGVVSRGHLFGRDILVKNYSQLQAGDFVISKRQVVHGATGIIPKNLNGAIVSNEYLVAVNSSSLLTEFLTILASLPDMRRKFFLSSYGVDIEKLFFDAEDWKKRHVTIPGITEQTQIGEYFRELDSLIGLHQCKHDKLVTLKKAMLQKMFPQPGATTPEVRFKGFEGDWVGKKLGKVGGTQSGIGFPDTEQGGKTGTPFFKVSDMNRPGNELEMFTSNNYVSEEQFRRKGWSPIINFPAVIFAKVGAALMLNRKRLIKQPFLIDNNLMAYLFDASWDADFGRALFETINLPSYAQVGALPSFNASEIESITVQLPEKSEQQKIGIYFHTLDALISKHATQFQKLQQLKSACLEKMFA